MKQYRNICFVPAKWLYGLPSHWGCKKVGVLFSERKTKVSDKEYFPLSVAKIGMVPQLTTAAKTDAGDNRKLVRAGDFVINSRSDRKGSGGIADRDGSVSLVNIVLIPREGWNKKYVHYLLRCQLFSEEYYRHGKGIVADLWVTKFGEMKNILLPIPPQSEQEQIVRFLDWKVSSINKLIKIKKQEIRELENLKRNIIADAITHGIKPDTKMKNSGIAWMGKVPRHWKVLPLKRCLDNISDIDHDMPLSVDKGYPYLMTGDLKNKISLVRLTDCKQVSEEDFLRLSRKSKPKPGNVIFARYATIGTVCFVDIPADFLVSYSCLNITPGTELNGKYLFYYMKSSVFLEGINQYVRINTQGNVGLESIRRAICLLPPYTEQEEIIAYLDKKCSKIDDVIAIMQKQILDLQELKARLISDVVTGKMDVRDIVIPEYDYVEEENNGVEAEDAVDEK